MPPSFIRVEVMKTDDCPVPSIFSCSSSPSISSSSRTGRRALAKILLISSLTSTSSNRRSISSNTTGQQSHVIFGLFFDTGGYRVHRKLQIRSSVTALAVVLRRASNSSPKVTDLIIPFIVAFTMVALPRPRSSTPS
ncbi:hypothetical protein U1Q18_028402 [Sarracenia purpurea var. burkii]